jgi:alkanesulfonate monooxygenase
VADTEDAAWAQAEEIRQSTLQRIDNPDNLFHAKRKDRRSSSVGSERLQQQAKERDVYDERLWFGITAITGPGGNSTALVGTAEQVAESLQKYRDLGVDSFLIRGFDPLGDVVEWGKRLVPLLREQNAGQLAVAR